VARGAKGEQAEQEEKGAKEATATTVSSDVTAGTAGMAVKVAREVQVVPEETAGRSWSSASTICPTANTPSTSPLEKEG
jgi:hypothetical protein